MPGAPKFLFEALEPRLLLSGDIARLMPVDDALGALLDPDAAAPPLVVETAPDDLQTGGAFFDPGSQNETAIPNPDPAAPSPGVLVFIDPAVEVCDSLLAGLTAPDQSETELQDTRVVILDAARDGIAQITETLAGQHGIEAIHIVSHGSSGVLDLGNTQLTEGNLGDYADQLGAWTAALTEGADILVYGCEVGQGEMGLKLVQGLAELTGADVAASIDDTGSDELGGDWVLELCVGAVEAHTLFRGDQAAEYAYLLDTINGTSSDDNLNGTIQDDEIHGLGGNDQINGLEGNDTLYGDAGNDTLRGGEGNDVLWGGAGNDTLWGLQGNDTYKFENGWGVDTVEDLRGSGNYDTLDFSAVTVDLVFTIKKGGTIIVEAASWSVDQDGMVSYTPGVHKVTAKNIEHLIGGQGNDIFIMENGAALAGTIVGGGGTNQLNYTGKSGRGYTSGVSVDLSSGTATNINRSGDNGVAHIQVVVGGRGNDSLTGSSGVDWLYGGAGNDTIRGGEGGDFLYGGAGNDSVYGEGGNDSLYGGTGDDTFGFDPGWGEDRVNEKLNEGTDTLELSAVTEGVEITFTAFGPEIEQGTNTAKPEEQAEIEKIIGGVTYEVKPGLVTNFVLDNKDVGHGTLDFSMFGETSELIFSISPRSGSSDSSTSNKVEVTAIGGEWSVTAYDIENIKGGRGLNTYAFINGGTLPGELTYTPVTEGGTDYGENVLDYSQFGIPVTVNLGEEYSLTQKSVNVGGSELILGREETLRARCATGINRGNGNPGLDHTTKVIGSEKDDVMVAGSIGVRLKGGSGNDYLIGGTGPDFAYGNAGRDILLGLDGNDQLIGGPGEDWIEGGAGDDDLIGESENDTLDGGAGADTVQGNTGNDTLLSSPGIDLLEGGAGDDTYRFSDDWGNDLVVEDKDSGKDTLDFSNVTQPLTHILSGGQLVSGTGEFSQVDGRQQGQLKGLKASDGLVYGKDFLARLALVGTSQQSSDEGTFTLSVEPLVWLPGTKNTTDSISVNATTDEIEGELESLWAVSADSVTVTGSGTLADPWKIVFQDKNDLRISVDDSELKGGRAVLETVSSGFDPDTANTITVGVGQLKNFENIKAAAAQNTFLFGDDWGYEAGNAFLDAALQILPIFGSGEKATAWANRNRQLQIDTSMAMTQNLVLDFRAVSKELEFTFDNDASVTSVDINRVDHLKLPVYGFEFWDLTFNTIKVTDTNDNTTIYGGRDENTYIMKASVQTAGREYQGELYGGTGRRPIDIGLGGLLDTVNDTLGSVDSFGFGLSIWVINTLDISDSSLKTGGSYASFASLGPSPWGDTNRITDIRQASTQSIKSGGLGQTLKSSLLPLLSALSGVPGRGPVQAPGLLPGKFFNIDDITYGAGVNQLFGSGILSSFPTGANRFSIGSGTVSLIADLLTLDFDNALGTGFHFLAGMTGSDSYSFEGAWGLGIVAEAPSLRFDNLEVPEFFDTLDFSEVKGDLDVTIYPFDFDGIVSTNFITVTASNAVFPYSWVVATDIENIIGSRGVTTIRFEEGAELRGAIGAAPGGMIVLDYSSFREGSGSEGIAVDLGAGLDWPIFPGFEIPGIWNFPELSYEWGSAEAVKGYRLGGLEDWLANMGWEGPQQVLGNFAVSEVSKVIGTAGNDILTGNKRDNIFVGNGGVDNVQGGDNEKEGDTFSLGGLMEGWVIDLSLDPIQEIQVISHNLESGNFTLSFGDETTGNIAHNATAQDVEDALNELASIAEAGAVEVTGAGTTSESWTVTFKVAGFRDQITSTSTSVMFRTIIEGQHAWAAPRALSLTPTQAGIDGVREVQTISHQLSSGTFTLLLDESTTAEIAHDATAGHLANALNALASVADAGGVTVAKMTDDSWTVTFDKFGDRGQISSTTSGVATSTLTEGVPEKKAVLELATTATSGTFTLSFDGQTTTSIAYDATAQDVASALDELASVTEAGGVTVSETGAAGGSWRVTFNTAGPRLLFADDRGLPSDDDKTTLLNIENIAGGQGDDLLFGDGGDNTFYFTDGWGVDTVDGGEGKDTLDLTGVTHACTASYDGTIWVISSDTNRITASGIETVKGGKNIKGANESDSWKIQSIFTKDVSPVQMTGEGVVDLAAVSNESDEQKLRDGLDAFATWAAGFNPLQNMVPDIGLPFIGKSLDALWNVTGDQLTDKIGIEIKDQILSVFDTDDVVTTSDLLELDVLSPTTSSELKEFQATLCLADVTQDVDLSFDASSLFGNLGFDLAGGVTQSEPIRLDASLDLEFVFGLDPNGLFYIEDPQVRGHLSLGHENPIDIELSLGPVGVAIAGGTVMVDAGLSVGATGRYYLDDFAELELDAPVLDRDSTYEIDLPIKLMGAIAGHQKNPASISAHFNTEEHPTSFPDGATLGQFLSLVPATIRTEGLKELFDIRGVSLDELLEGMKSALIGLAGDPGRQEIQEIYYTGDSGTFTLKFEDETTEPLDYSTSADDVQAALEALDGITDVEVDGTGTEDDPWEVRFLAKADVAELTPSDGTVTVTTVTEGAAPDGVIYRNLPVVNQSLVGLIGGGSADFMSGMIGAIETVQESLANIQLLEIDLNEELNRALGLNLDLGGDDVAAAYRRLTEVLIELNGQSTDQEIAVAMARAVLGESFDSLIMDRDVVAAFDRLDDKELSGESTDQEIATALADATVLAHKIADRNRVAGADTDYVYPDGWDAAAFMDAWDLLAALGLDQNAADEDIGNALNNEVQLDLASEQRDVLLIRGEADYLNVARTRFGLSPETPDDEVEKMLTDAEAAAFDFLIRRGVRGDASEQDISDLINDRSSLDEEEIHIILAAVGAATSDEISAALSNQTAIADATAALNLVRDDAPADITDAAARLQALGLNGRATDLAIATALADEAQLTRLIADRDFLRIREVDGDAVYAARQRLAVRDEDLGGESTDMEIALAVIDSSDYDLRKADRDTLRDFDEAKILTLSYKDSTLFTGLSFEKDLLNREIAFQINLRDYIEKLPLPEAIMDKLDLDVTIGDEDGNVKIGVDVFAGLDLGIGFDLSDVLHPTTYLSAGSGVSLGVEAATVNPVDIDVSLGLEGFGSVSFLIDDATAALRLAARYGLVDNDLGRYAIGEITGSDLRPSLEGFVTLDLPLYLSEGIAVGGSTEDLNADGYADNVLHLGAEFAGGDIDWVAVGPGMDKLFDLAAMLNDPATLLAGLEGMFDGLNEKMTAKLGSLVLPFMDGGTLDDASAFISGLRERVLGVRGDDAYSDGKLGQKLQEAAAAGGTVLELVRDELSKALSASVEGAKNLLLSPRRDADGNIIYDAEGNIVYDQYEIQTLSNNATGGTFTIIFGDPTSGQQTTEALAYDASAADVQAALANLSNVGHGNVTVASESAQNWTITFKLGGNVSQLTTVDSGLQGGTSAVSTSAEGRDPEGVGLTVTGDAIQFNVLIADTIWHKELPLDFDASLPGLGLKTSGNTALSLDLGYVMGLGFGLSKNDGIYLDTSGVTESGAELGLTLTATLSDESELTGQLGFLKVLIEETDFDVDGASGLYGTFEIDLQDDGGDGRWNILDLETLSITARLTAGADAELKATVSIGEDSGSGLAFPSLETVIRYDQVFAEVEIGAGGTSATFGGAPVIEFKDVKLNLGEFITGFVGPIVDKISLVTDAVRPVVDVLTTPISLLEKLGASRTSLLSIAKFLLPDQAASLQRAVDAVQDVIGLVDSVAAFREESGDGGLVINLGSFTVGGDPRVRGGTSVPEQIPAVDPKSQVTGTDDKSKKAKSVLNKIGTTKGSFQFMLLSDPKSAFGLLLGKDVDLFKYDMPALNLNFHYNQSFPIFIGLNAELSGQVKATTNFTFGFDTSGFNAWKDEEFDPNRLALLFQGFYLDDHVTYDSGGTIIQDLPEVSVSATITAGAYLGIGGLVKAGVNGGITADIAFDLNDNPAAVPDTGTLDEDSHVGAVGIYDGKLFGDELLDRLRHGPQCLFDMSGTVTASLDAYLWVGIKVWKWKKTLYYKKFTFLTATLADFDKGCTLTSTPDSGGQTEEPPVLAVMEGTTLHLNMGPRAGQRIYGNTEDGNERFIVSQVQEDGQAQLYVSYAGFTSSAFSGVTSIVAHGGAGDDEIIIEDSVTLDVELHGDLGDDTLRVNGSGKARLYGDAGNDLLVGGAGDDYLEGGDGTDVLEGGQGEDELRGGDGADTLKGGRGDDRLYGTRDDDVIYGEEGDDRLFGGGGQDQLDGGDGSDTIYGDDEDGLIGDFDTIVGGDGNDIIYGGPGDDVIDAGAFVPEGRTYAGAGDDDTVHGDAGDDELRGGPGSDTLRGGDGNDLLYGDEDDDEIHGDDGDDRLNGGAGADRIYGGNDNDVLEWDNADGVDTVIDPGLGDEDVLLLIGADSGEAVTLGQTGDDLVQVSMGSETFAVSGVEIIVVEAGEGADAITINDLSSTTVDEINVGLGAGLVQTFGVRTQEQQAISVQGASSGTFTLSFGGQTTGPIPVTASAEDVGNALAELGALTRRDENDHVLQRHFTVTPSEAGEKTWIITFTGALNGENVDSVIANLAATTSVATTQDGGAANEAQEISIADATGGTFTLQLGADATAEIDYDADAAAIQAALESLAPIGADNVIVTGIAGRWRVTFVKLLAGQDVEELTIDGSALEGSDATFGVATDQQGGLIQDEIQTISVGDAATGTFRLYLGGRASGDLAYDTGPDELRAVLMNLFNAVDAGSMAEDDLLVTHDDGRWTVRFQGSRWGGRDIDQLLAQANPGLKTTDGTVTVTTLADGEFELDENDEQVVETITSPDQSADDLIVSGSPNSDRFELLIEQDPVSGEPFLSLTQKHGGTPRVNFSISQASFANWDGLTIHGGAGNDTIDISGLNQLPVRLSIVGGTGDDTLIGPAGTNTWTLSENNAGSLTNPNLAPPVSFSEVETIAGGPDTDMLIAPADGDNIWTLSGDNAGDLNGALTFSQIENLIGGTGVDNFAFEDGAALAGTLDGGGGINRLDYSAYTAGVIADLEAEKATGTAGILNIRDLCGGAAADLLRGNGDDNILEGLAGNDEIIGGAGNDTLFGGEGMDSLTGGTGIDTIFGDAGNDSIYGGAGADVISGGGGDDWIYGDAANHLRNIIGLTPIGIAEPPMTTRFTVTWGGDDSAETTTDGGSNDTIYGDAGVDTIYGNEGDDSIWGGTEGDTIYGGIGQDTIHGDAGADLIYGGLGDDTIYGDDGADEIYGEAGVDTIHGNEGDDLVWGGIEGDTIYGGIDQDTIHGDAGADLIYGGLGDDTVYGDDGADEIYGEAGVDTIHGNEGDDLVWGGTEGDTIYGGIGQDTIHGDAGADLIFGGLGDDRIYGDDGADEIYGDAGVDTIHGNEGDDLVWGGTEGDTIYGGIGQDTIHGDAGADLIFGGLGDDRIYGDDGADEIYGDAGVDTIHGNEGDDLVWGGADDDTIYGDEGADTIHGDAGDDLILGGLGGDTIYGDDGADEIYGDAGDDLILGGLGGDTIAGDAGIDVLLGDGGLLTLSAGSVVQIDTTASTASGADTLYGQGGADILIGGGGADALHGEAGDDVMLGDTGVVTLVGGTTLTNGVVTRIETGLAAGHDTLFGHAGDDIIIGGAGADTIDGGAENDLIFGDNVLLDRAGNLGNMTDPRFRALTSTRMYDDQGNVLIDRSTQFADPHGSPGWADWIPTLLDDSSLEDGATNGDPVGDYIAGGAGHDVIFGQLGDDVLQGDGSVAGAVAADPVGAIRGADGVLTVNPSSEAASDGDDYIEGNAGSDVIFGNLGQDDIIGGSSSQFGLNAASQRQDGADLIFGGAGTHIGRNDTGNIGAEGHALDADVIVGDNANILRLVGVDGTPTGGFLSFAYDDYGSRKIIPRAVELLDYTPGGEDYDAAAINDIGARDELHGESGDDFIYGMAGHDLLFGEGQDDDLIGGWGHDWISGGTGDDGVLGDDGRIYTSRNGSEGEPIFGIAGFAVNELNRGIRTPGRGQLATINVAGELKKTAHLTPFNVDGSRSDAGQDPTFDPVKTPSDDIIFGGLGDDFLHGGAGDDAISGAEALPRYYSNPDDRPGADPDGGNVLLYGLRPDSAREHEFAAYDEHDPWRKILVDTGGEFTTDGSGQEFLLNFDATEGPGDRGKPTDGNDRIFGDLGNDWLVGGSGMDNLYGGYGDDLLNADDDHDTTADTTDSRANDESDDHDSYNDRAYGGAGRDVLIANTGGDRLIDWVGEFNSYVVPFGPYGAPTISRTMKPQLQQFLYDLSASDGADPTRAAYAGTDAERNGEPLGELGLVLQHDADWHDQSGGPADLQPGKKRGKRDTVGLIEFENGDRGTMSDELGTSTVVNEALEIGDGVNEALSLMLLDRGLPFNYHIETKFKSASNVHFAFDLQSANEYKFAGFDVVQNEIVIGRRTPQGWFVEASAPENLSHSRLYDVVIEVEGSLVILNVGGHELSHDFGEGQYHNGGYVGVATHGGSATVRMIKVDKEYDQFTFDRIEDFTGGTADWFTGTQTGSWQVSAEERYEAAAPAAGRAAISMIDLGHGSGVHENAVLSLQTMMRADLAGGFVFDEYSADDFKFAALRPETNEVVIGHHTAKHGWVDDAVASRTLHAGTDYSLQVELNGAKVTVFVGGVQALEHTFNATTTDGGFGLLTIDGASSFASVAVRTDDPIFLQDLDPPVNGDGANAGASGEATLQDAGSVVADSGFTTAGSGSGTGFDRTPSAIVRTPTRVTWLRSAGGFTDWVVDLDGGDRQAGGGARATSMIDDEEEMPASDTNDDPGGALVKEDWIVVVPADEDDPRMI